MNDYKKVAVEAALGGAALLWKNQMENRDMQSIVLIEVQSIYHEREKAAMMRTAVALAQVNMLNGTNTKMMMQALGGSTYE